MAGIELLYQDDQDGKDARVRGSDNRFNASSRSDSRGYYNSRDAGQAYSVPFEMTTPVAGEYFAYWQNNHPNSLQLVISGIGVNAVQAARIKLHAVTGTAATGSGVTAVTPVNMNRSSPNTAAASGVTTAVQGDTGATGIGTLTSVALIDFLYVTATGHEEFRLDDRLRLGVGDAIALEYDEGTTGDVAGVMFGYYEAKGRA